MYALVWSGDTSSSDCGLLGLSIVVVKELSNFALFLFERVAHKLYPLQSMQGS